MKVSALQSFGLICGGVLLSAGCAAMQATPDANRLAKMLEDCGGPQRGDAQQPEKLNPSETADAASTYLRIRSFEDVFVKNERVAYTINAMSWNVDLGEGGGTSASSPSEGVASKLVCARNIAYLSECRLALRSEIND